MTGPQVNYLVGRAHYARLVLDNQNRVACVAQLFEHTNQPICIARVQSHAGFIKHKQGVHQACAEAGRETDALGFSARERTCGAIKSQVAQTDVIEIGEPGANFVQCQAERVIGLGTVGRRQAPDQGQSSADWKLIELGEV